MTLYALVFAIGFVASILATLLVRAIAQRRIRLAMGVELLAGILTIVAWQLWALTDNEWRVLFAELLGSVLGTGVALRWGL